MLTENLSQPLSLAGALMLLVLCWAPDGVAQQGQYRSRVMIGPEGASAGDGAMSVEELEREIASIKEPYARSSAGRHLARHYVQEKQYDKAIDYYRTALAAKGLSDIANREMLRELAQVYLASEDYRKAVSTLERALALDLVPEVTDYLLLAQANYRQRKYVAVVAALDRIGAQDLKLDATQKRQALALYYGSGAYDQSAALLESLLRSEPENARFWHQLAAVYLQQGKRRKALDHLSLALEKGVPFEEKDVLLLADLQAVNKNPFGAGEVLQAGLDTKVVSATGANYRKLFRFWLQARERQRATAALRQAASLSGDPELYLYLAQLQMEDQQWVAMQETLLAVCTQPLATQHVGKANFLLGMSRLKQGDEIAARRLFINATLIGGANAQAGQWLNFMEAAPATKKEARIIVSPCYDEDAKRASLASLSGKEPVLATGGDPQAGEEEAGGADLASIDIKVEPARELFYLEEDPPLADVLPGFRSSMLKMGVALVKAGGSVDGSPMLIASGSPGAAEPASLQLALPFRGRPQGRGRYRTRKAESFKCAYLATEVAAASLPALWGDFVERVQAAGHELNGEWRMIFDAGGNTGKQTINIELQLGIR